MTDPSRIHWRLHLSSSPDEVYEGLATEPGRTRFWAEEAPLQGDHIVFRFPNDTTWSARVVEQDPPRRYSLDYLGTVTTFELRPDGVGGTDLQLTARNVPPELREGFVPGWVSVLLAMKAAIDFGVDVRNHDPARTWDQGYVDN